MSPGLTLKFKVATSWVKMLFFLNTNNHSIELCGMSFSVSISLFLNFTLHSHSSCSQLYFSPFFASRLTPYRPSYLILGSSNALLLCLVMLSLRSHSGNWALARRPMFSVDRRKKLCLQNSNSGLLYRQLTDFCLDSMVS